MYRALSDRFTALNVRLEKTVNEANSEIEALRRQVKSMSRIEASTTHHIQYLMMEDSHYGGQRKSPPKARRFNDYFEGEES
jgi:hypothetical protein